MTLNTHPNVSHTSTRSLHLSAGTHTKLESNLLNQWVQQLGQPTEHTLQHAVWQTKAQTENFDRLFDIAHQTEHDTCLLNQRLSWKDFNVLAMDMDSTLINIECIDEIADYCGKKAEVSAITEAAMRGEITDFSESLRRRVALLKDLPIATLQAVLDERLQLNPGAQTLVNSAHANGIKTLLVSGGFTFFTNAMQARLGLSRSLSNTLNHHNGLLDGTVAAPIINAQAKREAVATLCQEQGVSSERAIAMGDGSNDLDMMSIAGLSVAYHAKPAVQAQAMCAIRFGGLDTLAGWLNDSNPLEL